uniref:Uncharacterized protein n=1 Tax=Lutzomyia longipalpis TaxID=7200 RepID=A0A1B0CEZ2_LUTLO
MLRDVSLSDGKFILELASARENENGRTAWVAVPRKTFWPPTAPPFTNNYSNCNKNESSTSLSCKYHVHIHIHNTMRNLFQPKVSDDNSSIQSSPWQRDHCWKQLTPRRNISQEMSMLYIRPASLHLSKEGRRLAKVKKRRPYDVATALNKIIFSRCHNGVSSPTKSDVTINDKDCTDAAAPSPASVAPSAAPKVEVKEEEEDGEGEGECEMADAEAAGEGGVVDNKKMDDDDAVHTVKTMKTVKILKNKIPLSTIVQKLMDRLPTGLILLTKTPALVANHHFSASSSPKVDNAHHQQHVSPRKRILREFERVSLDDTSSQSMKRHRAKNSTNTVVVSSTRSVATAAPSFQSGTNAPSASATVISKTVMPNGSGHEAAPPPTSHDAVAVTSSSSGQSAAVSKPISSYSIISLLSHNNSKTTTNDKNPSTSHAKEHESTVSPTSPCDMQSRLPPKKKQSPPYGNSNWSPKPTGATAGQRQNSSPSPNVGSPSHSYNLMRSPDLSPSPEQQHSLSRYKSHYTGLHYSGTAGGGGGTGGSTTAYHPYLTARGSPSGGTSSPSSETYNSRYRSSSSYVSGSPQHNRANNNSPSSSSPFSRYSPIPNSSVTGSYHHPPVSPQHFGTKVPYSTNHPYGAPVSAYSNNRLRSTSPCRSPSTADAQNSLHKKTAQSTTTSKLHRSPVASPHAHETSSTSGGGGGYMGSSSSSSSSGKRTSSLSRETTKSDGRKYNEESDRLVGEEDVRMMKDEYLSKEHHIKRDATPPDTERAERMKFSNQELEYLAAFSKANSHHLLSGIDMAFAAMIRPPPYLMYPPTHSGSPLHAQPPPGLAAFLPTPPFFSPMYPAAAASAMYRQQSWLHFPPLPSASRLPSASLLPYDAAGLGPSAPSATSPSAASTTPWGSMSR